MPSKKLEVVSHLGRVYVWYRLIAVVACVKRAQYLIVVSFHFVEIRGVRVDGKKREDMVELVIKERRQRVFQVVRENRAVSIEKSWLF